MEPRIQYAKTADGVNIAFWTMGEGPPIIYLPPMPQHVQLDWQFPEIRQMYEWLASRHRLVRIDRRSTGLSQRSVEDLSPEARLLDIAAVMDRLGLGPSHLSAHGTSAPVAILYAASHPERIRSLLLLDAYAFPPDMELPPANRAVISVLGHDWETCTEMMAGIVWGWGEQTHRYAGLLRESLTWDDAKGGAMFTGRREMDLPQLLSQIAAPTLVAHHMEAIGTPIEVGRSLAAEIPHARLVGLQGRGVAGSFTDPQMMAAVDEFLAEVEGASQGLPPRLPSGMTAILFADIVDSTALTEILGDTAFRAKARQLGPALRALVRECGGTPVEGPTLGDGVLAVFQSARQAIEAALACGRAGDDAGLPLHLGLHAGDVSREKDPDGRDNVYGGAVNIAARVSALAAPGEVLVSDVVRSLARTSAGVGFEDRGEREMKGVGEPVRVWAIVPSAGQGSA